MKLTSIIFGLLIWIWICNLIYIPETNKNKKEYEEILENYQNLQWKYNYFYCQDMKIDWTPIIDWINYEKCIYKKYWKVCYQDLYWNIYNLENTPKCDYWDYFLCYIPVACIQNNNI